LDPTIANDPADLSGAAQPAVIAHRHVNPIQPAGGNCENGIQNHPSAQLPAIEIG
jgi:hypothetical protein